MRMHKKIDGWLLLEDPAPPDYGWLPTITSRYKTAARNDVKLVDIYIPNENYPKFYNRMKLVARMIDAIR